MISSYVDSSKLLHCEGKQFPSSTHLLDSITELSIQGRGRGAEWSDADTIVSITDKVLAVC